MDEICLLIVSPFKADRIICAKPFKLIDSYLNKLRTRKLFDLQTYSALITLRLRLTIIKSKIRLHRLF